MKINQASFHFMQSNYAYEFLKNKLITCFYYMIFKTKKN